MVTLLKFETLEYLIEKRGIRKSVIARELGISEKTLRHKMQGKSKFSWEEACKIQCSFFPDIDKDTLLIEKDSTVNKAG